MTLKADGTNGILQQYDYQVSTTGFSYTFAAGTTVLVMNPAGTLATGTITMPASPVDGMTITFSSTQTISALTLNGNTGQTVVSKVTVLSANQATTYVYRLSNTTWYPMSTVATNVPAAPPAASMVRLITSNGYGSTNTVIKRYTTTVTNQGSDITYADSATLGASFTINTSGVYAATVSYNYAGIQDGGFSLNSTQLTTGIASITATDRLAITSNVSGNQGNCSWTGYISATSVLRVHTQGSVSATAGTEQFTIVKVS